MKNCKICNSKTNVGFNINFELIPICESCATSIFKQQADYYVAQQDKETKNQFFCSEYEYNEGIPKCDKQCKDCKNTENKTKK